MPALPPGYSIRRLEAKDYEGVVETLKVLTVVGDVTKSQFEELVKYWNDTTLHIGVHSLPVYNPHVVVDETGRVVATGTVFIERKIIRGCGLVGHVEDIAVAEDQQGTQLGLLLIQHLTKLAHDRGCYKVILDCDQKNVGFYEKCGYRRCGVEMDHRL
ncbi:LANO_0B02674g1_1 [Lachancea nothofagi CBS 11611]|uniref:Glucosamine 6-phosphate N-acetyltransferase n=1 Tax=Lachancea nothofagi CBS 11611 TaxID=1266666 RepID=A0A1G4IW30_9SACH|nr:LANO_0B02674g1_1 [Lachancea nothofagi CBS 11611]